jgi:hypothetical protein
MIEYSYTRRDLLSERESYAYARCADARFLDAWRLARDADVERIRSGAHPAVEAPRREISGTTALADMLAAVKAAVDAGDVSVTLADARGDEGYRLIEPLLHKFEVFRRLFSHYDAGFRRHVDAVPAGLDDYVRFGNCLASIVERGGPSQALSTLLKLGDSLCSQAAASFTPDIAARLDRLMRRERQLVERLL